jgi:ubiquinone biosynthesis protein Coq4
MNKLASEGEHNTMQSRQEFQQATKRTDAGSLAQAIASAKRGEASGRGQIATAMAWAAYACPDAVNAVFDNISSAWLGTGPRPEIPLDLPEASLPDSFWQAFWRVVDGPEEGYDAISITVAVAALSAELDSGFEDIAEHHAANHPGAKASLSNPVPGHTDIAALAACPEGSLGRSLHSMIVGNDFDPEVLDRQAIMLNSLPRSLQYLNTRILQMHDVWHLVAGYETTGTHEIAISSFQLAQFGHNYSSMFLAAGTTMSCYSTPKAFPILMQIIAEAWQHGRNTTPMMDIEWEDEWNHSLEDIRESYGISTYNSVFPADLMETMDNASFLKKVWLGLQLLKYNRQVRKMAA